MVAFAFAFVLAIGGIGVKSAKVAKAELSVDEAIVDAFVLDLVYWVNENEDGFNGAKIIVDSQLVADSPSNPVNSRFMQKLSSEIPNEYSTCEFYIKNPSGNYAYKKYVGNEFSRNCSFSDSETFRNESGFNNDTSKPVYGVGIYAPSQALYNVFLSVQQDIGLPVYLIPRDPVTISPNGLVIHFWVGGIERFTTDATRFA